MTLKLTLAMVFWPAWAGALTLDFPANADLVSETATPQDSYDLPIGPWRDGTLPTQRTEGEVTRQVWQIDAAGITTLQLLAPLREQLRADGFEVVLDCETTACGGFDFRFGTEVAAPPAMLVDLSDYRFLSARRDGAGAPEAVSLLISRTRAQGYVQVIRVGPVGSGAALATTDAPSVRQQTAVSVTPPDTAAGPDADFATRLDQQGHVVLSDLTFESGSAQLGPGPFASLRDLADYLLAHPERTVALVGHTDASGSLEGNIALSKRRAGSVLERLAVEFSVPRSQMDAQGMGYLAPISTNLTPEGRDLNRRVEVIVTSTE